jgi:S-DNA-T family DNA segregation ATPase FtsK/SpoIIIE
LTGIFLILGISANRLGIWFWDLFAIIVLSVLFGFATSVPELGGTVGYVEFIPAGLYGKTGTLLILIFGLIIYVIF